MAIDTSLFGASIPAGTYATGDVVELKNIAGPAVVRSGRGAAILKRISTGILINASGSITMWAISVKNSDWIDEATNLIAPMYDETILDERSGCIQNGHNMPLTPNSSWTVTAKCLNGGTTTVGNSIYALIDVDYPSVSSIVDPDLLIGCPTSIEQFKTSLTYQGPNIETATWTIDNVDFFKAGNEYALAKTELYSTAITGVGFIALANAAGMGGLMRIIPITTNFAAIRNRIEYASKLVKGPMDIKYMLFNVTGTAATGDATLYMDYVKRQV